MASIRTKIQCFRIQIALAALLILLSQCTGRRNYPELEQAAKGTPEGESTTIQQDPKAAMLTLVAASGAGMTQASGFFISEDGVAVSSFSVFKDVKKAEVQILTLAGEVLYIDEILARNGYDDYIVFRVRESSQNHSFLPLALKPPKLEDQVLAMAGSPAVSSEGRVLAFSEDRISIQTSVPFPEGAAGGPLLNQQGEVVGIVTGAALEDGSVQAVNTDLVQLVRFK